MTTMNTDERLTQLETKINSFDQRFDTIDKKFDETNQAIRDLRNTIETGFATLQTSLDSRMNNLNHIFLAGMIAAVVSLAGIVISDRFFQ